jgi:acyl carrier protein
MTDRDVLSMFKTVAARVDKRAFPKVTRDSVITELGIDSLSMMQIVGELETELGVMIPDEDLVELRTVGDLCSKVEKRLPVIVGGSAPKPPPA